MSASPDFYTDGHTPRRTDTELVVAQKILGCLIDGGGGGGGGSGLAGSGAPEGVVTAPPGTTYLDTDTDFFYVKATGTGNTGWIIH